MTTCTRILEFDAAHRVLRHESHCSSLHGHRYKVEITCKAERLDSCGRVIDFGVIKEKVGKWIDAHWDHTTLVNVDDRSLLEWCVTEAEKNGKKLPYIFSCEPSAENIACLLLHKARHLIATPDLEVVRICVWETPNCYAVAEGSDILVEAIQA